MGNATSANGKTNSNGKKWLPRHYVATAGGLLLGGFLVMMVITGFAKKLYHAAEYMPMLEYKQTLDSLKNIEQDDKIAELEEQLDDIEKMVRDIWRNQVPHWQREKTEITLRGEEPDTT